MKLLRQCAKLFLADCGRQLPNTINPKWLAIGNTHLIPKIPDTKKPGNSRPRTYLTPCLKAFFSVI